MRTLSSRSMAAMKLLLLLLFLTISTISMTSALTQSTKKPPTIDFIRKCCNTTLYPDVCISSLSPSAAAIRTNPLLLARAAASVALSRLRSTRSRFSTLANSASGGREAAALRDCANALGDAVDQMRRSASVLGKMASVKGAGSGSMAWRVSGVQTWMSAALTNEVTCGDGFDGIPTDPVEKEVISRVTDVKKYSSNALALVNMLVR